MGLANAVLLAQKNTVVAYDVNPERVSSINEGRCPFEDYELALYLREKSLNLSATVDPQDAYQDADFIIIATPTNYDPETNYFDTRSVESVAAHAGRVAPDATIIIKSTVPVGFTRRLREELENEKIFFSPEFLREGKALYDNLYPSRIIVGQDGDQGHRF